MSESAIAQQLWQEVWLFDEKANDLLLDFFSHLSLHLEPGFSLLTISIIATFCL